MELVAAAPAAVATEKNFLLVSHQPSSSLRYVGRTGRNGTTVPRGWWFSPRHPTARRGICCALKKLESSDPQNGDHKGSFKRTGRRRPEWIEDDVYTVDGGWNIEFAPTEEMTKVGGIDVPVRITKQLQKERRVRRVAERAPPEPPRATHKLLRVMAGRCAGKKLTSPADAKVRPMMEVVRGAVFNILKSVGGWTPTTPSGRWLDLYSGTGSVAIEALSRGCCAEAHFVELDPWVITNVLTPNLMETNCLDHSVVHTAKVETWLQQALDRGADLHGGAFDYVSVTPPYEAVSYPELMAQLSESPLLNDSTFVVVEYPLQSKREIPDSCGSLNRIRDRRYGRTHVVIYGPKWVERDEKIK